MTRARPVTGRLRPHAHQVSFHTSREAFAGTARDFLTPALQTGHAAIAIVVPATRAALVPLLAADGWDVAALETSGHLLLADAATMLGEVERDESPDAARFHRTIGALLASTPHAGRDARVVGEMVAVYWALGNIPAAITLEDLWNVVDAEHEFTLLCGYPQHLFDGEEMDPLFLAVCEQHETVLETRRFSSLVDIEDLRRAVGLLQREVDDGLAERAELLEEITRLRSQVEDPSPDPGTD